jgi:hypothetical protein
MASARMGGVLSGKSEEELIAAVEHWLAERKQIDDECDGFCVVSATQTGVPW